MIQLFLSKPLVVDCEDGSASANQRISLLRKLESAVCSLILSSGGRSEARLWLYKAISGINSITPRQQQELFSSMLKSEPIKHRLAAQLMRLILQTRPRKAGIVLSKKSHVLEYFFKGNSRRIKQWFSNFTGNGVNFSKGAKALSRFAFVNRDTCWEELEWKGKHGQSPAMVATKPHYFLDLDTQQTVNNFVENVPEFWSSDEFAESLTDGEIFSIDTEFFKDLFVDLMIKDDSSEVWDLTKEFLKEESFSSLCHHLLVVLREGDLCILLELLRKYLNDDMNSNDFWKSCSCIEFLLLRCSDASVDHLLLLNALINQGRQLLLLLRDDEIEEKAQIEDIVMQFCKTSKDANDFAMPKKCLKSGTVQVIKWFALQSWVLHYLLHEKCWTPESWEALFIDNGINFHKSGEYLLLNHDECYQVNRSDLDDKQSLRGRHKKGRSKKKQRRNCDHDDSYHDGILDNEMSTNGLRSKSGCWFLATDEYSTSWNSVDLPEYLSKHCFSTWMRRLCSVA